jgi:hypothetical protein
VIGRPLRLLPLALLSVAVLLTSCLDSCRKRQDITVDDGGGPGDAERGPPDMSPGTLRALGPHVWDASLDVRGDRAGLYSSREVVSKLVWADLDRSLFEEIAGGRLNREIRIADDVWRLNAHDGQYRHTTEVGGTIIQLRTLEFWDQAVAGFARQLAWQRLGADAIDGRPVTVWKLQLAPPPALDSSDLVSPSFAATRLGLATTPISLNGTVYVDDATGNRLLAEVSGRFVAAAMVGGRDPTDEVQVTYRERRSLTAVPPSVEPPDPETIFAPRRPRPPGVP